MEDDYDFSKVEPVPEPSDNAKSKENESVEETKESK